MARVCYIFLFLATACSPTIKIKKALIGIENAYQDHVGLVVYDPALGKTLLDYQGDKYFTPASNTKIFTFFGSLKILGDSIPSLKYELRGDSLFFWGTGDPSFLYPLVSQSESTFDFLKQHKGPLAFSNGNFLSPQFGPGWAWDDYLYSYSPERSSFPIYGNLITLTDTIDGNLRVMPKFFEKDITYFKAPHKEVQIERSIGDNKLMVTKNENQSVKTAQVPFHVTTDLVARLLSDTLNSEVSYTSTWPSRAGKYLYSVPADSLYKVMMQESDNFIAEQLLLVCAGVISDTLDSQIAIDYVKRNFLNDLPDRIQWVDGSGLSRYNLFTPRSIIAVWEKILKVVPQERLFKLLAIGGKAGTIKESYNAEPPYIYGKTGTLSNNHCLSGFLITKRNRLLIFSFMNSHYTVPSRTIRSEMESVLKQLHEKY